MVVQGIQKTPLERVLAGFFSDSYRTQTCNLLIRSQMLYSIELRSQLPCGLFVFSSFVDSFLDAGLLTGEVAEVEDTCATHFTVLVHLDFVNERGLEREDSFDSDTTGNFPYGKGLRERIHALHLDDDTSEFLVALLVSFLDPVGHGDGVTGLELREFGCFAAGKSLLCYFDQIHNFKHRR